MLRKKDRCPYIDILKREASPREVLTLVMQSTTIIVNSVIERSRRLYRSVCAYLQHCITKGVKRMIFEFVRGKETTRSNKGICPRLTVTPPHRIRRNQVRAIQQRARGTNKRALYLTSNNRYRNKKKDDNGDRQGSHTNNRFHLNTNAKREPYRIRVSIFGIRKYQEEISPWNITTHGRK